MLEFSEKIKKFILLRNGKVNVKKIPLSTKYLLINIHNLIDIDIFDNNCLEKLEFNNTVDMQNTLQGSLPKNLKTIILKKRTFFSGVAPL